MKANYNIKDNSELTKPQVHTGYIYIYSTYKIRNWYPNKILIKIHKD